MILPCSSDFINPAILSSISHKRDAGTASSFETSDQSAKSCIVRWMKSCISFSAVAARFAFSVRAMSVLVFARSDKCKSEMVFKRALTYCRLAESKSVMTRRDVPHHSKFPTIGISPTLRRFPIIEKSPIQEGACDVQEIAHA